MPNLQLHLLAVVVVGTTVLVVAAAGAAAAVVEAAAAAVANTRPWQRVLFFSPRFALLPTLAKSESELLRISCCCACKQRQSVCL